jgi:hypothetical protein
MDPYVGLNEAGNVSFEWWDGDKKLTLYIRPDATTYVKSWGPDTENDMDAGNMSAEDFPRFWTWLRAM